MESDQLSNVIIFVFLIVFSAFFSSAETAFTSASAIRLKHRKEQGDKKAKNALKLQENYDALLSTILIGNNLVNIAASAIATLFFMQLFPTYGATIATIITTVLLLLFGEITPKLFGKVYSETIAMRFSAPLKFFMKLFKPAVWLFQKWQVLIAQIFPLSSEDIISEEELLTLVDEARIDGSIEVEEHQLVKAAIEFDDRDVASILTPRVDVIGFDINDTDEEIEELFLFTPYSRLIVYEDTTDYILGTLHAKDFYRYSKAKNEGKFKYDSIHELLTKPLFVPASISPSDLLQSMQKEHTHIGVITDEYGGMIGIVTMEDIMEILVGEIWDESDIVRSKIKQIGEGEKYILQGTYPLEKLFDLFNMKHEDQWLSNTVSGFIMEQFERMPQNNDLLYYKDLKIIVVNAHKQRVNEVIVEKLPTGESE